MDKKDTEQELEMNVGHRYRKFHSSIKLNPRKGGVGAQWNLLQILKESERREELGM